MDLKELEKIRVFVSNKFGARNYQEKPVVTPFEVADWIREWQENLASDGFSSGVNPSMIGDDLNSLEFFDMIKKEWCVSEEQYKPFWNDVLTFARKYHKERKEYCG